MGVSNFLENIRIAFGLSSSAITTLAIIFFLFLGCVRLFNYIVNRIDIKDDKQFEVILKIIEDDSFLERLGGQPYLVKQLFYKRFYVLKDYKVEEIQFLMSQFSSKTNLHEISKLKSGNIIRFENGVYRKNIDKVTSYWANSYWRFNVLIVLGFVFWILISVFFSIFFLESTTLFYISVIPLLILELYLLVKVEVVKSYLKTKDDIDDFIHQSEIFKNNQGTT